MVVLSAAITTKNGKALLARQYVDMSRIRIEGLLAAFPKLMGTGNKQHTFIETDSVRYVYQPMETLFLLLVTNKASNIVEDLETLRMLSKVVPDVAGGIAEDKVSSHCFEMVFAFDEVLTVGGLRENITLPQIKNNLEMDSHEERLHNMIQESKREAAKDEATRKATEMRARQKALQAAGVGGSGGGMQGIGGNMSGYGSGDIGSFSGSGGNSFGSGISTNVSTDPYGYGIQVSSTAVPISSSNSKSTKGMKLGTGSKKGRNAMIDSLMAEENIVQMQGHSGATEPLLPEAIVQNPASQNYPVSLVIEEKLSVRLSREGTLEQLDVKGSLSLTANTDDMSKCKIILNPSAIPSGFAFQTHPKINRAVYDETRSLALKDQTKGFPVGRPVGVLRWSMSSTEESMVPLTVNCWPEDEGGGVINVSLEYGLGEVATELHNVSIIVPLGGSSVPRVTSADGGMYVHDAAMSTLVWKLDLVDKSNSTGSLEFKINGRDINAFFPVDMNFSSRHIFANVQVGGVTSMDGTSYIPFSMLSNLTTESYLCG